MAGLTGRGGLARPASAAEFDRRGTQLGASPWPAAAHAASLVMPGPHPSAGAVAVKKDAKKESHDQVDVPNLHMMKEMVSFKSRGFVTETFSW